MFLLVLAVSLFHLTVYSYFIQNAYIRALMIKDFFDDSSFNNKPVINS